MRVEILFTDEQGRRWKVYDWSLGQQHPTLIVNDVKSGANGNGTIALWIGPGTVAHFRNLTVKADPPAR